MKEGTALVEDCCAQPSVLSDAITLAPRPTAYMHRPASGDRLALSLGWGDFEDLHTVR